MGYDPDLFAGTAAYYWRYRPPYAEAAIDFIAGRLGLTAESRLLDLGCGPGTLALRFAPRVGEVAAWDPDPEMLAEGRALAAEAGVANIAWRQAGSEELGELTDPIRGCVMGQSFHWMDRDQVMRDLDRLVEPGGGVALVNPGRRRPQEVWEDAAAEVLRAYLGERPPHPRRSPEPHHYPALERSAFTITDDVEFASTMARDFASCLGSIYSGSVSARRLFGERIEAFEADLAAAILPLAVDGQFVSTVETAVIVAVR
jgi:ubiquinone/menaquinone biosynthesis C-methylase UbiE